GGLGTFRSLSADEISKEALKKAARDVLQHLEGGNDPVLAQRLSHLRRLLAMGDKGANPKKILHDVAAELKAMTDKAGPKADPTDLHYLAVLLHSFGDVDGAEEAYAAAVQRYAERVAAEPSLRPLQALCLTDRAWYEAQLRSKFE